MKRVISTAKVLHFAHREAKGLMRVCPWLLAALVVLALLWRSDVAAVPDMFQSSPVEPSPAPATATPTEPEQVIPTETATMVEATATGAPSGEPVPPTSTGAPVPEDTASPPAVSTASATVPPSATPTATLAVPTMTLLPPPTSETLPVATATESLRYPDSESGLSFDWGMLFDSVALGVSYLWLCCGILLLLAIPLVFAILWVASTRRRHHPD